VEGLEVRTGAPEYLKTMGAPLLKSSQEGVGDSFFEQLNPSIRRWLCGVSLGWSGWVGRPCDRRGNLIGRIEHKERYLQTESILHLLLPLSENSLRSPV
jgi:hypothetical protein